MNLSRHDFLVYLAPGQIVHSVIRMQQSANQGVLANSLTLFAVILMLNEAKQCRKHINISRELFHIRWQKIVQNEVLYRIMFHTKAFGQS